MSRDNVFGEDVRRRDVLATLGASAAVGLAGCGGDDGTPTEDTSTAAPTTGAATDTATATETATDTPTDTPTETATEESTPTPIEEGGPPDREGWTVTLADRFDGGSIDDDLWSYGMGGPTLQCPPVEVANHCWAEDHVWVDQETDRLVLQASEETPTVPESQTNTPTSPPEYTFGALTTDGAFEQQFGHFEAKVRMPAEPGVLPAFWLFTDFLEGDYREIDVVEITNDAHSGEFTVHYGCGGEGVDSSGGSEHLDTPVPERSYVWGCTWTPDAITWYVDGEQAHRETTDEIVDCIANGPLYVIFTIGVMEGADWIGYPENASFPAQMEVDWVQVWQHEEWA